MADPLKQGAALIAGLPVDTFYVRGLSANVEVSPPASRWGAPAADDGALEATALRGIERLRAGDPLLYELIAREHRRQSETLTMVAASSIADPAVLACEGTALLNTTTEGYPGARFHAGCEVVDQVERIAIERARHAFGARYANVQPHSGTSANQVVMFSLLRPGDTVLGLDLDAGGTSRTGRERRCRACISTRSRTGWTAVGASTWTRSGGWRWRTGRG